MPLFNTTAATESEQFSNWLADSLTNFRSVFTGLTTEQLLSRPVATSDLTLAWLLQHVGSVAEGWGARAAAAPEPGKDDLQPLAEQWASAEKLQTVADDATVESLLAEFDDRVAAAVDYTRETDLDAPAPVPDMPWVPPGTPELTGRWIILHVLEEVSRHSGHADLLREAVDGQDMYSLRAEAESLDMSYIDDWFDRHPEVPMPQW